MNKILTGAIAAAAGTALLLGGAGTFALWNSSTTIDAGAISSGTLALSKAGTGVWSNVTNSPATTIDPATFKIVPGNTVTYSQPLTVTATGNDLSATLSYNASTLSGTITGLTSSLAVTSASPNVIVNGSTITVTQSATPATVNVVLTVSLPASATGGQSGTSNFSALTFTLQQTTPVK